MSHQYWNLKQIVESQNYPFTMGQLRHLLHFRHRNGLENATRKIGKRLFLRIDLFEDWIERHAHKRYSHE